ncbi:MAG: DUF4351 domain-containing protein [Tepidanaerobacteraceae bacterium]|nr:DUF4351 domain-containing protein [Tepidanaerobacteraceae bacterium]
MIRIEDSVIYQDVIEKGMKKGIEKGMEKGKSQGKIEILMRQLKKKFKIFPSSYEAKLFGAKEETIDKIAEDIFDIAEVKDLDKYLQ